MRKHRPAPEQLRRLYEVDGLTVTELARRYDVARGTMTAWLKQAGVTTDKATVLIGRRPA